MGREFIGLCPIGLRLLAHHWPGGLAGGPGQRKPKKCLLLFLCDGNFGRPITLFRGVPGH